MFLDIKLLFSKFKNALFGFSSSIKVSLLDLINAPFSLISLNSSSSIFF